MKLHEKIYFCRKKAGLSQDALAERLGVSRQAISKWENGEAVPETMKLPTLAKEFGVTVDWLLSEDAEPCPDEVPEEPIQNQTGDSTISSQSGSTMFHSTESTMPEWIDGLPHFLSRMIRRFGWLVGVYIAVGGMGFTVIGALAKGISKAMVRSAQNAFNSIGGMNPIGGSMGDAVIYDASGNLIEGEMAEMILGELNLSAGYDSFMPGMDGVTEFMTFNPVDMVGSVIMVIGILMLIGGVILAVYLRKWGQKSE